MIKTLKTALVATMFVAVGYAPSVSAATCTITTTGQNSNNTCTVNNSNLVTITCTNGVQVANVNSQTAVSGSVVVSGNTISGTATSGDSANLNTVATELSQGCAPATTVATPAPVTPAAGGQGGGTVATPAPAAKTPAAPTKVAVLPKTGKNSMVIAVAGGASVIAAAAVATKMGVLGYRRSSL